MRIIVCLLFTFGVVEAFDLTNALQNSFLLSGERASTNQYFVMENTVIRYGTNGARESSDSYWLFLTASFKAGHDNPVYICRKFTIQIAKSTRKTVPSLQDWSYEPFLKDPGIDSQGQVFGIPHEKFSNIADSDGQPLDVEHSYAVYNHFIDFHSFADVFSRPTGEGNGIQNLTRIGDVVVHSAAFTTPPVNLGQGIKEGSFFQNGEITLAFKGVSMINERPCALVGFDSGASSFKMIMEPMPSMPVETNGSSHYFGDIFLDLDSFWVQKVTMTEFVLSETAVSSMNMKINGRIERQLVVRNVPAAEFEAMLAE
ncbi:MAG: hypothetical protein EHM72_04310 [Calditrichaeota bacterium]|nr:MAG: hypothetical protein EHM72_04310 [Calditrichota bacterium]